ncbi:MAG: hypothetical protein DRI90_00500 [Deltaproteobacteria bacterium]|nr:MAG: hypothetical protein DRI90_00500 [Deltaproteobacteria bacterium]
MTRRQLMQTVGVGWFADQVLPDRPHISGRIVGTSCSVGHQLGHLTSPASSPPERAEVVIVGSGVSGVSAAWRLNHAGIEPLMLELEPMAGGTSAWGTDGVVSYPWGAHYLPVPERGARVTRRLLSELGVITGTDAAGRPQFDEEVLCHAPEQRLYFRGAWHEGLVPYAALSSHERAEMERFRALQHDLMGARGRDGRDRFAIPCEQSTRDQEIIELDRISMAEWLRRERFTSPFLWWYVGYGTRDDFGAELDDVSAWAALHYFGARKLRTEQLSGSRYLVWPAGLGWPLGRMLATLHGKLVSGALVTAVAPLAKGGVEVTYLDVHQQRLARVHARAAIVAAPAFITRRLLAGSLRSAAPALPRRTSSPWTVANLHVTRPADANRVWDTMIYDSLGLGTVDASHQLTTLGDRTVLSYYRSYGSPQVAAARAHLRRASWTTLASEVLNDLQQAQPELGEQCSRIDVMVWAHGMPRPRPGFLGPNPFQPASLLDRHVAWAHVDQTGFAIFEEANLHGVRAAEQIADALGASRGESWL